MSGFPLSWSRGLRAQADPSSSSELASSTSLLPLHQLSRHWPSRAHARLLTIGVFGDSAGYLAYMSGVPFWLDAVSTTVKHALGQCPEPYLASEK
eukprot:2079365-Rhodomonas_salina.1